MSHTTLHADAAAADADADLTDRLVAICQDTHAGYCQTSPFDPPERYPELVGRRLAASTDASNHVYATVRESFRLLGLDASRFGDPDWNPLQGLVNPGDRVMLKPNWVSHQHGRNDSWQQLITHGSVIRAVADYVQLALQGQGEIILADGPLLNTDFAEVCRRTGATEVMRHYASLDGAVPLELIDLREVRFETRDDVVIARHPMAGDPRGTAVVNLARHSALYGFQGEGRYYGADYDTAEVNRHHCGELHEYRLSASAMGSNVIIDIPKLKTHHKVGVTMALKGVVGLNCGRNWLPHRTQGTPQQGGDQFSASGMRQRIEQTVVRSLEQASLRFPRAVPHFYRFAKQIGKRLFGESHATIRGGGWHGNNTLWRMVLDINRALMYADRDGKLQPKMAKRRFCVVDGIVAGEGFGPMEADPAATSVILAGRNPLAVDVVGAELMGFDYGQIPMLAQAFLDHPLPLIGFSADAIMLSSNVPSWAGKLDDLRQAQPFAFEAPLGWTQYVERNAKHPH